MHFRSSVEDGADIGRKVAAWVAQRYFYDKNMEIPTTGLQLWLRADAGVDTLNGTVSRWHDQSGNGNDAFQADIIPAAVPVGRRQRQACDDSLTG